MCSKFIESQFIVSLQANDILSGNSTNEKFWKEHFEYSNDGKKTKLDFLSLALKLKADRSFIAYQLLDWWPVFDFLATHGHFVSNAIIVICATQI
jgi:hypothetical protein